MTRTLDPMTVERLARLIVDIDGPFERRGYQLAQLLERVEWPGREEYDGSPRVAWLTTMISEGTDDFAAVSRLLCRVCDPLEYDDGLPSADVMRKELNLVLASEQLAVAGRGSRPRHCGALLGAGPRRHQ